MEATKQELDHQLDLELLGTFPASDPPTLTQYPSRQTQVAPISGLADAILNTAADAIIATDRAGSITFWNAGHRESLASRPTKRWGVRLI